MLRTLQSLIGYRVRSGTSAVGVIDDLLFDTVSWLGRYWVINSTGFLETRGEVFVPIGMTDWVDHALREITLSTPMSLLEKSPNLREASPGAKWPGPRYSEHYQWPFFWTGAGTLGTATVRPPSEPIPTPDKTGNPSSLYSFVEALRYKVRARGKRAGFLDDFIVDDQTWSIRYLVLTPRRWWPTKNVALTTHWVTGLSWRARVVSVDLPRERIASAPKFDRARGFSSDYEEELLRHYADNRLRKAA